MSERPIKWRRGEIGSALLLGGMFWAWDLVVAQIHGDGVVQVIFSIMLWAVPGLLVIGFVKVMPNDQLRRLRRGL
jgi:hypothetical protein